MCRALTDPKPRRCPCSQPERRAAVRHAASVLSRDTTVTEAPSHEVPVETGGLRTIEDEQALAATIQVALETGPVDPPEGMPFREATDWLQETWETRRAAVRDLTDKYGSVELAVTAAGDAVARRAEEYAGMTAEEARTRYEDRVAAADAAYKAADDFESRGAASTHLRDVRSGTDSGTQADMRALADGYQRALADLRTLGGTHQWDEGTAARARAAAAEALSVYPADWVTQSNVTIGTTTELAGGILGATVVTENAPVVRLTTGRAHYAHYTPKEKILPVVNKTTFGDAEDENYYLRRSRTNPAEDITATEETRDGRRVWSVAHYDVQRRPKDAPPSGRDWEWWQHPDKPERGAWRRPLRRKQQVGGHPEITVSPSPLRVADRSPHFRCATHELAHRFEWTVPGITRLEESWLERRTTDPATGEREPLSLIYPNGRGRMGMERGRRDAFVSHYMGKEYQGRGSREVLSMGMESLFAGSHGGLVGAAGYEADHDMRAFVLGVLATVGRKK